MKHEHTQHRKLLARAKENVKSAQPQERSLQKSIADREQIIVETLKKIEGWKEVLKRK